MKKPQTTLDREARQRAAFKERMKPYVKFTEYMIFGTASITTSLVAGYAVVNLLSLGLWQERAVLVAIAITLLPAILAVGKYIIAGMFNAAKE